MVEQPGHLALLCGRRTKRRLQSGSVQITGDGRLLIGPLVPGAPDEAPAAVNVAVAEEVAVAVHALGVLNHGGELLAHGLEDGPLGRGIRLGLFQALAKQGEIVLEEALEVFVAGRLAEDLLQAAAVIVADEEVDRVPLPFGLGHHAAEPLEEDLPRWPPACPARARPAQSPRDGNRGPHRPDRRGQIALPSATQRKGTKGPHGLTRPIAAPKAATTGGGFTR